MSSPLLYNETPEHEKLHEEIMYTSRIPGFEQALWLVSKFKKPFNYCYTDRKYTGLSKINSRVADVLLSIILRSKEIKKTHLTMIARMYTFANHKNISSRVDRIIFDEEVIIGEPIKVNIPIVACSFDEIYIKLDPYQKVDILYIFQLLPDYERKKIMDNNNHICIADKTFTTRDGFIIPIPKEP